MSKVKMSKDIVPEGFSVKLALVDAFPVLFFGLVAILLGIKLNDIVTLIGAIVVFVSGALKVLWKIIVATKKKNVWALFLQMRIAMPIGFLIIIIGFVIQAITTDLTPFWMSLTNIFSIICFVIGFIGMGMMIVFSVKLDSSDVKSNWIEQITNGFSQLFFFLGLLISLYN